MTFTLQARDWSELGIARVSGRVTVSDVRGIGSSLRDSHIRAGIWLLLLLPAT